MTTTHIGHVAEDIAYHVEWEFRREALRWRNGVPIGVNLHPIATEFHQWLLRKSHISVFAEEDRNEADAYSNPYTYHASVLATILAAAINDSYSVATATEPVDAMDADIRRIRIYNEQILYIARLCEALIKQLLYCTQIGRSTTRRRALVRYCQLSVVAVRALAQKDISCLCSDR